MAEPESNLPQIPRGLEDVHCAGVPEDMWRQVSIGEGGTLGGGSLDVLAEYVLEAGPCHGPAGSEDEQLGAGSIPSDGEPRSDESWSPPKSRFTWASRSLRGGPHRPPRSVSSRLPPGWQARVDRTISYAT